MKKLRVLLTAAILASTLLVVGSVTPVAAVTCGVPGNHNYAIFYKDAYVPPQGPSRIYCYNTADLDMATDPGNVMGPLWDGLYKDDWCGDAATPLNWCSGVTVIKNYTGVEVTGRVVCMYAAKNFVTYIGRVDPGDTHYLTLWNDRVVSMYWLDSVSLRCIGQ